MHLVFVNIFQTPSVHVLHLVQEVLRIDHVIPCDFCSVIINYVLKPNPHYVRFTKSAKTVHTATNFRLRLQSKSIVNGLSLFETHSSRYVGVTSSSTEREQLFCCCDQTPYGRSEICSLDSVSHTDFPPHYEERFASSRIG